MCSLYRSISVSIPSGFGFTTKCPGPNTYIQGNIRLWQNRVTLRTIGAP